MSAVADVLNGAADLIERDGWTRLVEVNSDGAHCTYGAMKAQPGFDMSAVVWLQNFLSSHGPSSIVGWNDHPGRTKAEVVAALRAAAERAS